MDDLLTGMLVRHTSLASARWSRSSRTRHRLLPREREALRGEAAPARGEGAPHDRSRRARRVARGPHLFRARCDQRPLRARRPPHARAGGRGVPGDLPAGLRRSRSTPATASASATRWRAASAAWREAFGNGEGEKLVEEGEPRRARPADRRDRAARDALRRRARGGRDRRRVRGSGRVTAVLRRAVRPALGAHPVARPVRQAFAAAAGLGVSPARAGRSPRPSRSSRSRSGTSSSGPSRPAPRRSGSAATSGTTPRRPGRRMRR